MCFVCLSASVESGQHPNHIDNSIYDNGIIQKTYQFSTSTATSNVQALVDGSSWGTEAGQAVTVTYSFDTITAFYPYRNIVYSNNPIAFNAQQQAAALDAMGKISAITNITFVQAASATTANLTFYFGDLNIANTAGVTGYLTQNNGQFIAASLGMDDDSSQFTTSGTYDYTTLLHELGHAVGLKHPGDYYNGAEPGPYLPANLDNTAFTVMSYNDDDGNFLTNPTDYQALDIEALQYLYGVGAGSNIPSGTEGDDTQSLAGSSVYFAGGGSDTVFGSTAADTIYGGRSQVDQEDGADSLQGAGGADLIFGNSGDDTIFGGDNASSSGDGSDIIWGGRGYDIIYGNLGDDQIGGGGDTYAPNDEADLLLGGAGNDAFTGNGGDDTIYGDNEFGTGNGNDSIHGGRGNDSIVGGGGSDTIIGGTGNDTMTGNAGADFFLFSSTTSNDVITDFTSGEDKLQITINLNGSFIVDEASALAATSVVDGNLVFDFGLGHTLTLQGVTTILASDVLVV